MPGSSRRFTILLAEDDADVRDALAALLSKRFHLLLAANGSEALRIISDGRWTFSSPISPCPA